MTGRQSNMSTPHALENRRTGAIRTHAGQGSTNPQPVRPFLGLMVALAEKNERAPRREVAWLVAKLYAFCPFRIAPARPSLAAIGRCRPTKDPQEIRFPEKVRRMLPCRLTTSNPPCNGP